MDVSSACWHHLRYLFPLLGMQGYLVVLVYFSKEPPYVSIKTNNEQGFPLLCILVSTCYWLVVTKLHRKRSSSVLLHSGVSRDSKICWILQKSRYHVTKKSVTLLPFTITIFTGVMWNFTRVWIWISLMIGDVKQHFTKLFKFFFESYLLKSVVCFRMSLLFCYWAFGLLSISWVLASR